MVSLEDLDTTITRIHRHYVQRQRKAPPRVHLGASEIGRECERQVWYGFRWAKEVEFPGQILRLFDTGKLEENRFIADLNAIGVDVRAFDFKTGRQFRVEMFGGHFGGSLDGLALGFVEAPKTWHVLEMKTHNDKSFKSLCAKGVRESKPDHYIQVQSYMGMTHETPLEGFPPLTRTFYIAVNKNNDELYIERIEYDGAEYLRVKEKARRIVFASTPPPKISKRADFFQCKWCTYQGICHAKREMPFEHAKKNCRTCLHSTPLENGTWKCEKWNKILCLDEQRQGCEKHLFIPQLIPFEQVDVTDNSVVYDDSHGNPIVNYEGGEISQLTKL